MLPHGLEPWTSRLLAERSDQLSYESSASLKLSSLGARESHSQKDGGRLCVKNYNVPNMFAHVGSFKKQALL